MSDAASTEGKEKKKKQLDVKNAKAVGAAPPPLVKGRRGSQIPTDVLEGMVTLIKNGEWASIDHEFSTREKASTAQTRFKKALVELLPDTVTLSGRIWGDHREADSTGAEVHAAPFHFALGDKAKVG
jgi:hypothetical protein